MIHGLFLVLERIGGDKYLNKLWKPLQHIYALFVVVIAWVLFRAENFQYAWDYYKAMFGFNDSHSGLYELSKYLNNEFYLVLFVAVLASTQIFKNAKDWLEKYSKTLTGNGQIIVQSTFSFLVICFYFGILILCSSYLLSDTYNPFIYYRF